MSDREVSEDAVLDRLHLVVGTTPRAASAHHFVRESLRRAILIGQLPAGTRLILADLAATFSVSTTPVRDAIRDLVADGLVRLDHRGGLVERITPEKLEDIIQIREALEPVALRRTIENADAGLIKHLRYLNDLMADEESASEWVNLNRQFHQAISDASGSPRLASILRQLGDVYAAYGSGNVEIPGTRERGIAEHAEIIDAIEKHDLERATRVMVRHVRNVSWTYVAPDMADAPGPGQPGVGQPAAGQSVAERVVAS